MKNSIGLFSVIGSPYPLCTFQWPAALLKKLYWHLLSKIKTQLCYKSKKSIAKSTLRLLLCYNFVFGVCRICFFVFVRHLSCWFKKFYPLDWHFFDEPCSHYYISTWHFIWLYCWSQINAVFKIHHTTDLPLLVIINTSYSDLCVCAQSLYFTPCYKETCKYCGIYVSSIGLLVELIFHVYLLLSKLTMLN